MLLHAGDLTMSRGNTGGGYSTANNTRSTVATAAGDFSRDNTGTSMNTGGGELTCRLSLVNGFVVELHGVDPSRSWMLLLLLHSSNRVAREDSNQASNQEVHVSTCTAYLQ